MTDQTVDELRSRVLVILSEALEHTLSTGYACRRIMAEVVAPLVAERRAFAQSPEHDHEFEEAALSAASDPTNTSPGVTHE